MAGVTDKAFRSICLDHGAFLTYTEMISAKGLEYSNKNTWDLLDLADNEQRIAVQLFGHEPDVMARQAYAVQNYLGEKLALIDINMGCPVKKVVNKGEGSALMKTPELAAKIVRAMSQEIDAELTVKFRSGWDSNSINAVEFALLMQEAGAQALAIHGRSARQMYAGNADWSIIKRVKDCVNIPIIGSGNVYSYAHAISMIETTGVDAVMIARGARGNPWIFKNEIPNRQERFSCMLQHLHRYVYYYGSHHLTPLRAQLAWYMHGMQGASHLRYALSQCETFDDFERLMSD